MTKGEAIAALEQAGLVARGETWETGEGIRGGRSCDLAGTLQIPVFQKAFGIHRNTDATTFTVMHMLDRLDFEFDVASWAEAVAVVLIEYRKAGLLP